MTSLGKFVSKIEFDTWHENKKADLKLPKVNFRASDGKPQPDKTRTIEYTEPLDSETTNEIIAPIDNEIIVKEKITIADDSFISSKEFFKYKPKSLKEEKVK